MTSSAPGPAPLDPDGRARAQRQRRGHPGRQPDGTSDPGVRQRGRELGRQVNNPRRGDKGNGGGIYSSGTVTLDPRASPATDQRAQRRLRPRRRRLHRSGVTLVASHVDSNTARNAAGIFNVFGSVEVLEAARSTATPPMRELVRGDLGGGGIGEMAGNVMVSDSQVNDDRSVGMFSGGIVILLGGVTVTDGSQIDGNSNNGPGGGIAANFEGAVTISHGSQVDGNTGCGPRRRHRQLLRTHLASTSPARARFRQHADERRGFRHPTSHCVYSNRPARRLLRFRGRGARS